MKFKIYRLIVCLPLILFANIALAVETVSVYAAEIAVPGQSAAIQDRAVVEAFRVVLQKMSGLRSLPETISDEDLAVRAAASLQSVNYSEIKVAIEPGNTFSELRLHARFDPGVVNEALVQLQLPRWPADRQSLQFIMAVESDTGRRLLSTNDKYLAFVARDTAQLRGLPLAVSLEPADQEFDISWLQEIWGGFTDTALAEARAQGHDGVLLAAASRRLGLWQVRWSMAVGDREWTWTNRGEDLPLALKAGIHGTADRVAASAQIAAEDQGIWLEPVEVLNIRSNRDYLRCLDFLQGLNLVSRVDVVTAEGARIVFRLQLNAAPEYLHQSLQRSGFLSLVGSSMGSNARAYEFQTSR